MRDNTKSQSPLGKALTNFATSRVDNPYQEETPKNLIFGSSIDVVPKSSMRDDNLDTKKKKKKKDKGLTSDLIDEEFEIGALDNDADELRSFVNQSYDPEFDDLIENLFEEDEDTALKNNLVSLGRKYARMVGTDAETSEISKAFSKREKALDDFIEELDRDSAGVQRDIEIMRGLRSRNYKALSDLISARSSMYNVKLSAIKQLTDITKSKFDLSMKMKKSEGDMGDSSNIASQAVQKLLGAGHKSLIDSVGGRAAISGAIKTEYPDGSSSIEYDISDPDPDELHDMNDEYNDSDGDKFIKYENEDVEYVVDFDTDNDSKTIYAINKDGDLVEDYPMPSNIDDLAFNINELSGYATDQLHRSYKVRYNGVDLRKNE